MKNRFISFFTLVLIGLFVVAVGEGYAFYKINQIGKMNPKSSNVESTKKPDKEDRYNLYAFGQYLGNVMRPGGFVYERTDQNPWLLFRHLSDDKLTETYKVFDASDPDVQIAPEFSMSAGAEVFYDPVNDGFIFINQRSTTDPNNSDRSVAVVDFMFFSAKDKNLHTFYTTRPTPIWGKGCLDTELMFKPGSVHVKAPGCFTMGNIPENIPLQSGS